MSGQDGKRDKTKSQQRAEHHEVKLDLEKDAVLIVNRAFGAEHAANHEKPLQTDTSPPADRPKELADEQRRLLHGTAPGYDRVSACDCGRQQEEGKHLRTIEN